MVEIGEIAAKGGAVGTISGLAGLLLSLALAQLTAGQGSGASGVVTGVSGSVTKWSRAWVWFWALTAVHLWACRCGLRLLALRTLTLPRLEALVNAAAADQGACPLSPALSSTAATVGGAGVAVATAVGSVFPTPRDFAREEPVVPLLDGLGSWLQSLSLSLGLSLRRKRRRGDGTTAATRATTTRATTSSCLHRRVRLGVSFADAVARERSALLATAALAPTSAPASASALGNAFASTQAATTAIGTTAAMAATGAGSNSSTPTGGGTAAAAAAEARRVGAAALLTPEYVSLFNSEAFVAVAHHPEPTTRPSSLLPSSSSFSSLFPTLPSWLVPPFFPRSFGRKKEQRQHRPRSATAGNAEVVSVFLRQGVGPKDELRAAVCALLMVKKLDKYRNNIEASSGEGSGGGLDHESGGGPCRSAQRRRRFV